MTSVTKDSEGTWLSPPRIRDKRWPAPRIIFLDGGQDEERGRRTGDSDRPNGEVKGRV